MLTLDLGTTFDAVLAWDSFFHLSHADQRAMFRIFAAHAAPDAILLVNTGPTYGVACGDLFGDKLFHASLAEAEYRQLFDAAGFDVLTHRVEDPDAGGRTGWTAKKRRDPDV